MVHGDFTQAVAVYTQLLEAWNSKSAEEFAGLFEADGSAIGFDGSQMNGRDEIAATLRNIFDHHPTARYVAKVREIRRVGQDVLLLRAVVGMVPPGVTELNPAVNAVQSLLLVGREGQLRIALLHNTPAAFHGRPELVTQLTEELAGVHRSGRVVWSTDLDASSLDPSSTESSRRGGADQ